MVSYAWQSAAEAARGATRAAITGQTRGWVELVGKWDGYRILRDRTICLEEGYGPFPYCEVQINGWDGATVRVWVRNYFPAILGLPPLLKVEYTVRSRGGPLW
jgi:hypothetical protein